jgi:hypothetical protein
MGSAASALSVASARGIEGGGGVAASVDDYRTTTNLASFGTCRSLSNPQVAAATSAALGVLTPQPCVPAVSAPWSPGSTSVSVLERPALHAACRCTCQWGGAITITTAGQEIIDVD